MSLKQAYVTKTGSRIVGTYDVLYATAKIDGFTAEGEVDFTGSTEVHWETQSQVVQDDELMFMCEDGQAWPRSALEFRDEDN